MAEPHSDEVFEYEEEKKKKEEDDSHMKEYLDAFSVKDAILEPGISKTFEQFLDLGGNEDRGVEALSASYVGLPGMVNTMIEWLHAAGFRKREIQSMVEEHLKTLILRHFDPKKADLIFTEEGSTPSWLEDMIQYSTWRELFYQLAEQYHECLMLKFTIKLISDAGYQSEITSASTASHQPEVFSGLVRNALTQITSCNATEVHKYLSDFTHLVCHSQQTYFYSQAVLYSLISSGRDSGEENLKDFQRWLGEEMQKEAHLAQHEVTNMSLNFCGVGSHARLFEALAAMLSRNALNPADISILYKHYSLEEAAERPPPVHYLHVPQLLELLVQAFFKPGSTINPDHKEKYLYILSYAVSVYDQKSSDEPFLDDLQPTKKAIEMAHMICSRASASHAELQVEIPTLFECINHPVVAMGVVRWVELTLTDSTFFEEAAESSSLFLVLLDEVAFNHALQHPFILELLKKLIEGSYPTLEVSVQLELKRSLVDRLVQLFSCGHVLPVVDYVHHCMVNEILDQSHIRHFVAEVLSIVRQPYSQDFTSVFLPLVQNNEITAPLLNTDGTDLVSVFLAECSRRTKKRRKTK